MCATLIRSCKSRWNIKQQFFFSFHASFTFIFGFYGRVFGDFFGVFGYKHWQVWQARRLSTCCTLTNETGDCARWWHTHTLELNRNSQQTKHVESIFKSRLCSGFIMPRYLPLPQATYQKTQRKLRDVCANWMCQNLLLTCKRKRERKWVGEWAKSLYS